MSGFSAETIFFSRLKCAHYFHSYYLMTMWLKVITKKYFSPALFQQFLREILANIFIHYVRFVWHTCKHVISVIYTLHQRCPCAWLKVKYNGCMCLCDHGEPQTSTCYIWNVTESSITIYMGTCKNEWNFYSLFSVFTRNLQACECQFQPLGKSPSYIMALAHYFFCRSPDLLAIFSFILCSDHKLWLYSANDSWILQWFSQIISRQHAN